LTPSFRRPIPVLSECAPFPILTSYPSRSILSSYRKPSMPFPKKHSTGEALIRLENSTALREFNGIISSRGLARDPLLPISVPRRDWLPRRVIAIDGSNLVQKVKNGFPGAEAGLVQISVVS